MKTLVVHSGTYKTGSTAIQLYLTRASGAKELGSATYPVTGRGLGLQHNNLYAEMRNGPVFTPRLGSLSEVLDELVDGEADTSIVSSENFSAWEDFAIKRLGDACRERGVGVTWIHYLREQTGFYNAFYVERLMNMRPEFTDIINQPFEEFGTWSPIDLGLLDYGAFADRVRTAIPEVDLRLRPFSRAHLAQGDVIADFCATLGIPHVPERSAPANIGNGWKTVETARRLTPLVLKGDLRGRTQVFENAIAARMRWVALIRSELTKASTEAGWNTESASYLTPEFRDVLLERYRPANERVAELIGLDWPAIAAAEPYKPYNIGEFADIPGDELMFVVDRVLSVVLVKPDEIRALPKKAHLVEPAARASLARRVVRRLRARK